MCCVFELQALRHYKALAALSLSEPSARGQCALLPPLRIYRRFEGVLQMHSMPLLDRSVDVASEMAERLGRLLRENAQFLVTRYEVSAVCLTLLLSDPGCSRLLQSSFLVVSRKYACILSSLWSFPLRNR